MKPGQLLVATPVLEDPNFQRSVVYLLSGDDGPAGVILNRPSELAVAAVLPQWAEAAAAPGLVHAGGPVAVEHALALGSGMHDEMVTDEIGVVDLEGSPDLVASGSIRVFAGYAGWASRQLEEEVEEMAWFIADGTANDVLDPDPATLWRRVLLRQGPPLRRWADYPEDPRLN